MEEGFQAQEGQADVGEQHTVPCVRSQASERAQTGAHGLGRAAHSVSEELTTANLEDAASSCPNNLVGGASARGGASGGGGGVGTHS